MSARGGNLDNSPPTPNRLPPAPLGSPPLARRQVQLFWHFLISWPLARPIQFPPRFVARRVVCGRQLKGWQDKHKLDDRFVAASTDLQLHQRQRSAYLSLGCQLHGQAVIYNLSHLRRPLSEQRARPKQRSPSPAATPAHSKWRQQQKPLPQASQGLDN